MELLHIKEKKIKKKMGTETADPAGPSATSAWRGTHGDSTDDASPCVPGCAAALETTQPASSPALPNEHLQNQTKDGPNVCASATS